MRQHRVRVQRLTERECAGAADRLLTDRAVAGGGLFLTYAGIEKMLKQRCDISGVGVCKEEPLCLFRTRRVNSQADTTRAPLCKCWQDIAIQFRCKLSLSIPLFPNHSLQRLEAG